MELAQALTWRYVVAFALIASLSTAAWLSLHLVISEQKSTAAVVNVSGRQRMLSQRTALFANLLVHSPESERAVIREKLQAAIGLMEKSHHGLTHGDVSMGLPETMSPAVHAIYFDGEKSLNNQVEAYVRSVRAYLLLDDDALTHDHLLLHEITQTAPGTLVEGLDRMVRQYQMEGEASVRQLQKAETVFWLVTLLLLMLEAQLIFRPFTQHVKAIIDRLNDATVELKLHQNHLEELVKQRTDDLEIQRRSLAESEEKFRLISTAAKDAIVIMGRDEQVTYWNPAAESLFGFSAKEATGQNLHNLITPERYRVAAHSGFVRFSRHGTGAVIGKTIDLEACNKQGSEFPVALSISAFSLQNNWHAVGIIRDVTERKRAEKLMRESEARLTTLLDSNKIQMWAFDGTNYTYTNRQWFDYTGQDPKQCLTIERWVSVVHPDDVAKSTAVWLQHWSDKTEHDNHFRLRRHDGVYRDFYCHAVPVFDDQGIFLYFQGFNLDVTERNEMEEQVRRLAFYDALTELPNRRMLNDRLSQALAQSKRTGRYGALMFIDLDNFKPLNDKYGHSSGDLLLIEVAQRLRAGMREMDSVARFGGDEFVVMLCELDEDKAGATEHAMLVASKILDALSESYEITVGGETIIHRCTASIGVCMFINHEASQEDLLKWADMAMYQAKDAGRNTIRISNNEG